MLRVGRGVDTEARAKALRLRTNAHPIRAGGRTGALHATTTAIHCIVAEFDTRGTAAGIASHLQTTNPLAHTGEFRIAQALAQGHRVTAGWVGCCQLLVEKRARRVARCHQQSIATVGGLLNQAFC
jgi:hypothetical protein